ncbi:hypothetical protein BST96_08365 [Oceanicoccus sagamiensis]|uniref:Ubiquinone biosynthesis accessory factor UbiK n=1 Tax=Oceanicoccus sagamiensis TaxID=716816 RepID=A0A1X9NGQ9_9GAMM|nr:hypothetical protein BST96_08365 [Oceanicoccus sagamiensis]
MVAGLTDKLSTLVSETGNGSAIKKDLQHNLRAVIQSTVSKLEMVSREEFDAQVAVLHRSREKIDQLEQQLQQLTELVEQQ